MKWQKSLYVEKMILTSLCFLTVILSAMEIPSGKSLAVFEQEVIHLDLPFPYEWSCEAFLSSPYLLRHYDERGREGGDEKKYKKEIFYALIRSRLSHKQSLDMPIFFWHKRNKDIIRLGTPLVEASDDNFISVTQMLLAKGADPNVCFDEKSPLEHAVVKGQEKTVRALLAAGAQVKDKQLLHKCSPNYNNILRILLAHGSSVHEQDAKGRTPLMICDTFNTQASDIAALVNRMRLLFSYGAKVNVRDNSGRTVLHFLLKGAENNIRPLLMQLKHQGLWSHICDNEGKRATFQLRDGRFGFAAINLVEEVFYDEDKRLYRLLTKSKSSPFKALPADVVRIIVAMIVNNN